MTANPTISRSNRFRFGRRVAVLVAVVAVLGTAYQLTRPPELVWWRSSDFNKTGHRVRIQIPGGWELEKQPELGDGGEICEYVFRPIDFRPKLLRWLLPNGSESAPSASVTVANYEPAEVDFRGHITLERVYHGQVAFRGTVMARPPIWAVVMYLRQDEKAFNCTYKQICNSLTIE